MRIAIFGGSGFIGRHLVALLAKQGHSLIIPVRHREQSKNNLILLPQTDVYAYDPTSAATMAPALQGADTVINLVGILHQKQDALFENVHCEFTRVLCSSCAHHKVKHFIQISAIGATSTAPSAYLQSKAKAEEIVRGQNDFYYTIVRPSVVFGKEDQFTRLFAKILSLSPVIPLPGYDAKMQPIAVEDLADLIANVVKKQEYYQKTLNAGGPQILTLLEIVNTIQTVLKRKRFIIPLRENSSYIFATIAEMIPFFNLISRDNCLSMRVPSICPKNKNDALIANKNLQDLKTSLMQTFDNTRKFDHIRLSSGR